MAATPHTYLSVPYAEKDQAKALGAKWDTSRKKWYVPAGLDLGLFTRWNSGDAPPPNAKPSASSSTSAGFETGKAVPGFRSEPRRGDFVPYVGDAPPWE
ncbi:DUF5710 domain-containing protein [Methylomagnum sp.]